MPSLVPSSSSTPGPPPINWYSAALSFLQPSTSTTPKRRDFQIFLSQQRSLLLRESCRNSSSPARPSSGSSRGFAKRMPPLHTGDASTMEKVIECFEVKVVDEESNCIWHPIRMWSQNSKERKNLGYCDGSNLNNRLAHIYAIKCGKTDVSPCKE